MNELDTLSDLIGRARAAGADAADAIVISGTSVSVQRRLGKTEQVSRAEGHDLGLRVFIGQRSASVSSSFVDPASFDALVARAIAMARIVPEDPYAGLATEAAAPHDLDLELDDGREPDVAALIARAAEAEDAALSVSGVTNSEGAEAGYSRARIALVTSAGFAGQTARSSHSVSATALAGEGTRMERDYDYSSAVHLADLEPPAEIGRVAGEKAIARLDPIRPKTMRVPVVYDPRVAGSILGHLSSAINGSAIARGTSFLKERMGQQIFARGISVIDDPRRVRGLRSREFDGEGVPTRTQAVIEDGVLTTWFLDSRTARQLGLRTTGHASRGINGPPSPSATNLYLTPGSVSPQELMADIKEGLYITEMMGSSINGITGDY
ncbi:MAG: TldD/PmbA family protein, partial [Acetobacteraceae bacterium]|nr:TldD/PmbA family protein [Acetobacteraceae bacterium]